MEIIAKTENGVIINATNDEVNEILNAVSGAKPEKLKVGMKIPAIDYASTIRKVQGLGKEHDFQQLISYSRKFYNHVQDLSSKVDDASNLE